MSNYKGQAANSAAIDLSLRQPSVMENLQRQKASLSERLAAVDAAIAALEAHPEVEQILTLLVKVI